MPITATTYYEGKPVKITREYSSSSYVTIKLEDGTEITVNKSRLTNDMFGINERMIASYTEQIHHNEEVIEENKILWSSCLDLINDCRNNMRSILKYFGVIDASELQDAEAIAQYQNYSEQKTNARSNQISATSAIIHAAHSTASAASSKMNAINQQALYLT